MLVPPEEAVEVVRPLRVEDVLDEPDVFEPFHVRGRANHEALDGHVERAPAVDHAAVHGLAIPPPLGQREHAEAHDPLEAIQLAEHALDHHPAARHAVLGGGEQVRQTARGAVVAHDELLHALWHASPDARAKRHVAPIAMRRRHDVPFSHETAPEGDSAARAAWPDGWRWARRTLPASCRRTATAGS